MKTLGTLVVSNFLLVSLGTQLIRYLAYGKERPSLVPLVRNLAWNEFIAQIRFLPADSLQDSIDKEILVIQRFLKEHETETKVSVYDVAVFRAIDQVRERLHKADKDLETLRNELSYKDEQAKLVR